jgi:hypothetical protein
MKESINLDTALDSVENHQINDSMLLSPEMVKGEFFNGKNMPCLALPAVYELFKRKDFPSFRIGRKLYAPRHLFIKWLEEQAQNKTEKK